MFKDGVPELPGGDGRLSFFKRCVWWAIWGGRFPFADSDTVKIDHIGGKYVFTAANKNLSPGKTVYVKACLEDGTECYVPIAIAGTIYRQRADTPGTTPDINSGKVPDGTPELL